MSENENETTPAARSQFVDHTTEEPIEGKAYILKSTEGEEVVDPARLFAEAPDLSDVVARLERIERELGIGQEPGPVEAEPEKTLE